MFYLISQEPAEPLAGRTVLSGNVSGNVSRNVSFTYFVRFVKHICYSAKKDCNTIEKKNLFAIFLAKKVLSIK